ncbi:OprO/OprP family phosphate-selective porin [Lysobacter hankyongensis]|uniref:OprO/OprP family phosphate-selective porin n=1 Tax=Lysobacter hankyongensis TaxID=1176535 RepID=A0ABP9BT67_9GAMM
MRHSLLALAVGAALAGTSLSASAQSRDAEIAELKAQIAALLEKVESLEERTDAQSDVNIDTAQKLDTLTTGSPKIETKGGVKVTSADGKFEAQIGGRIHFDAYAFDRDIASTTGTTEFRRARLTLQGKALGWEYKMEQDFGAGTNLDGLRDLYVAKNAFGGKFTIGHFKPYRSMEELTSSNEILMMERPFSSASGLFNARQFQQGVGYLRAGDNYTAGLSVFNLRSAAGVRNEGVGAAGRFTYAPINRETSTLHLGGWFSVEDLNNGSATTTASVSYAGRRGPSQTIATVNGAAGDKITAYGAEVAGSFGPAFFQGEYVQSKFEQPFRAADQDVTTWYLQGSWMLNGGHKPYKGATGVFGSPKVGDKGLWELTARYDAIENEDIANREANSLLLGVNYYVNPNLRFMFNYTQGDNEATGDETGQYALRTQFAF